jgi:hypothetical protein
MTDWTKKNIPRADLLAWHMHEPDVSANNSVLDYSGNALNLSCGAGNSPVIQTIAAINGQPAWYFNGSRDPLASTSSTGQGVKHAFILCSHEDATFNELRGVLSGKTSNVILVSNNTGDTFFDPSSFGFGATVYRKNDFIFANNNAKAPMSGTWALIELSFVTGGSIDGIQVGQQTTITARKWKGWWADQLVYSAVKNEASRRFIYEYYAQRYWVWQQDSAGRYVFPFAANKTRSLERDKEHYLSEPYDGDPKALVRGSYKNRYELPFLIRDQEELDAAKAFYDQHFPLTKFVFRDYRYYPYRDTVVRINSPFREQGSDVSYRFNYSFEVIEA